jgi:hypothetical protein
MAGKVLQSIETGGDPLSANGSVLSDDNYVEEGTPEPNDPEARLAWGRRRYGEDWYLEEIAGREAARKARREEEERERIEDEKVEAIRKLRETEPWEYERQMREYNLQLQGLTKAQIDNANKPLPRKEAERIWVGFAKRSSSNRLSDLLARSSRTTALLPSWLISQRGRTPMPS